MWKCLLGIVICLPFNNLNVFFYSFLLDQKPRELSFYIIYLFLFLFG